MSNGKKICFTESVLYLDRVLKAFYLWTKYYMLTLVPLEIMFFLRSESFGYQPTQLLVDKDVIYIVIYFSNRKQNDKYLPIITI